MPFADAENYRFNACDLTKVWSQRDYPKIKVGTMTLNRNPENFFAQIEQSAFEPSNFVPGIGPSPDKITPRSKFIRSSPTVILSCISEAALAGASRASRAGIAVACPDK